ncbi:hypothetical protein J6590_051975 [Homalodisca vitripennis]|nr:hypothetical protein J6590_051975 [Homalodisca vitripennis]
MMTQISLGLYLFISCNTSCWWLTPPSRNLSIAERNTPYKANKTPRHYLAIPRQQPLPPDLFSFQAPTSEEHIDSGVQFALEADVIDEFNARPPEYCKVAGVTNLTYAVDGVVLVFGPWKYTKGGWGGSGHPLKVFEK